MSRSDRQRIGDMLMAADEIAVIVGRGRAAFDEDRALPRALERCLEILGEAAKGVAEETRQRHPSVPWQELARVRDLVSHHYHRIDPDQLWAIAEQDLPPVAAELRSMLE